jgi:predicted small lipoprotein YifL
MKKLTQKFLAAGLTAALIPFTLAGCGQKPVSSPETAPNSSVSLSTSSAEESDSPVLSSADPVPACSQSAARSSAPQTVSEAVQQTQPAISTKDFTIKNGVLKKYTGHGGNVVIPDGVTEIGYQAFKSCLGLTKVVIPGGVKKIGLEAFFNCSSLKQVTIPESVTEIGGDAFRDTPWLKSKAGPFVTVNGILLTYKGTAAKVSIPTEVKIIAAHSFWGYETMTSIQIPNGVTEIGDGAFYGCTGLTSVSLPGSVTEIGSEAFESCENLSDITMPGIRKIDRGAFSGCQKLKGVSLPKGLSEIGEGAFEECTRKGFAISGYAGTAAEAYAKKNSISFRAL